MTDTLTSQVVCTNCMATNRIPTTRLGDGPRCGRCKTALFSASPAAVDDTTFDAQRRFSEIPLLVDFWAAWCGPCKMMAPAYEAAAGVLEPHVRLLKVDTEAARQTAARYQIRSIPTLMLFSGGNEVARTSGAMDTGNILAWVRQQGVIESHRE